MNVFIIIIAKYLFIVSIIIFLYVFWKLNQEQKKEFIIFSVITFLLSYIIAKLTSHFIYDPRPFVLEHVKPLFSHVADNGFPSDHMLLTMTIAAIVFIYNKKLGIFLTAIAICIGMARIAAKVHHLEDIAGSIVIAISATGIVYIILPSIVKLVKKVK